MFWQVREIKRMETEKAEDGAGRFVLHRHTDAEGPHLDLRLECGDYLAGWRIAGEHLEEGCWATEKMPHPASWLDQDGEGLREMAGTYAWHMRDAGRSTVALTEGNTVTVLNLERCEGPSVAEIRALVETAHAHGQAAASLPGLIEDGMTARARAVERFCGLSRTLDGNGFDEEGWRRLLSGMSLREIGERLSRVETRYDLAHPPAAVSRPEPLPGEDEVANARTAQAFRIAAE